MRYAAQARPISYLKANMDEVLLDLAATREPLLVTQNGEARAVLQDVASFEQTQESLALLKLIAIGYLDIREGHAAVARDVIAKLKSGAGSR